MSRIWIQGTVDIQKGEGTEPADRVILPTQVIGSIRSDTVQMITELLRQNDVTAIQITFIKKEA